MELNDYEGLSSRMFRSGSLRHGCIERLNRKKSGPRDRSGDALDGVAIGGSNHRHELADLSFLNAP